MKLEWFTPAQRLLMDEPKISIEDRVPIPVEAHLSLLQVEHKFAATFKDYSNSGYSCWVTSLKGTTQSVQKEHIIYLPALNWPC